ncbi:MAG: NTP transferase domain-containing protein [Kiritimatiellae bacterium]|nr:NTP transferase domain-containing protein [Kiritimatiellia bacterium]
MSRKSLVVLAAGIGSRYGGLKQLDPVGPSGEVIVDYSVYDAIRAGFEHVVFVIRPDIEADFKATIGARLDGHVAVDYVHQRLEDLPGEKQPPAGREKPWGTGQATLAAASVVDGPFAVINADDFYGAESFQRLADALDANADDPAAYCMVGFVLGNTLSDHGYVSRGICALSPDGLLEDVVEKTHVERSGDQILAGDDVLTGDEVASMNMWGFKPSFFGHLTSQFETFLETQGADATSEFYVPAAVNTLICSGEARVKVLASPCQWVGVTYPEEKADVKASVTALIESGAYPTSLWA